MTDRASEIPTKESPGSKGAVSRGLLETDRLFDPTCNLIQRPTATPGYHTKLAPGTLSHSTRESINYAQALFETSEPCRHERARKILARNAGEGSGQHMVWIVGLVLRGTARQNGAG